MSGAAAIMATAERVAGGRPIRLVADVDDLAAIRAGDVAALSGWPDGSGRGHHALFLEVLQRLPMLANGIEVVARIPSARNLRSLERSLIEGVDDRDHRSTRGRLEEVVRAARLDLAWLAAVQDPELEWVPPPVERSVNLTRGPVVLSDCDIEVVEEATADFIEVVARAAGPSAPTCSIVILMAQPTGAAESSPPVVVPSLGQADAARLGGPTVDFEIVRVDGGMTAAAANVGLRAARGDFVVFLASDDVPDPGAIDQLVARASSGDVGAVGPLLVHPDRPLTAGAGFALALDLVPYPIHRHRSIDEAAFAHAARVSGLPVHGLAARRATLVRAGGFDEHLPTLWDADVGLRLAARGYRNWFDPAIVVRSRRAGTHATRSIDDARTAFREKWRGRLRSDDEQRCVAAGVDVHVVRARGWFQPTVGRAEVPAGSPPAVLWTAPVLDRSGYANEARTLTTGLHRRGVPTHLNAVDIGLPRVSLDADAAALLHGMLQSELPASFVHVCHLPHYGLDVHPNAVANVARTMWETDRLPERSAAWCTQVDEVWVPKEQNVALYVDAGVPAERVVVVPTAIDERRYGHERPPSRIAGTSGFVFLSLFFWSPRKGWDVLVRAFVEEFAPHEDVTLVIAGNASDQRSAARRMQEVADLIRHRLGRSPASCPRIIHLPVIDATPEEIAQLHSAADAFVLATRGEGAGLPILEAMASGVPVIVPRDCVSYVADDRAFLVDTEWVDVPPEVWPILPFFRGHRWAEPSLVGLREAMRRVVDDREDAQTRASRGREHVLRELASPVVAGHMIDRLERLVARA